MPLWLPRNTVRCAAGAAGLCFVLCTAAQSQTGAPPSNPALGPDIETADRTRLSDPRTILFNASEIGASVFSNAGFKHAFGASLHQEGFILMGNAGAGRQRDIVMIEGRRIPVEYWSSEGSLLLGYQWKTSRADIALMAGPEVDWDQTRANGQVVNPARPSFGGRLLAEVWAHPRDDTLLTGTLVLGSAPVRAWGRVASGLRVWDSVFVGPEAVVSVDGTYREARIGMAATGLRFRRWTLGLSAGLLAAEGSKPGAYVGITTVLQPW
jgi:hypothetical protein